MNLIECFRVALRGLMSNKMRAALTMLGIIIGVGVVTICCLLFRIMTISESATSWN